jgi:hypothetical protein
LLAPTPVSRRVDVRQVVKIIAESLSHDEKHVVPTPLSGIRVGGREIVGSIQKSITNILGFLTS